MKRLLKHLVINTIVLYAVSTFAKGLVFERGIISLLFAGVGLTVAYLVVKPIINLLLLPINLITFNLLKWISSAVALYLVTLVIPGFKITSFILEGFSSKWLDMPTINVSGALAYVAFSIAISVITSIIYWVIK